LSDPEVQIGSGFYFVPSGIIQSLVRERMIFETEQVQTFSLDKDH
jgi:hypothetical protein